MKRLSPSPHMTVAIIALLLATAGTATAAKLLTGKDIKNGTLTGVDVKDSSLSGTDIRNGSIGPADLSKSAKVSGATGATGPSGATGPQGDPGAQGIPGERGPSAAFVVSDPSDIVSEGVPGSEELVRLSLPAGTFTFTAKFTLNDNSGGNAGRPTCQVADLIGADELADTLDITSMPLAAGTVGEQMYTLIGTVTRDVSRPVALFCNTELASNQSTLRAQNIKLVAIQVASVN